MVTPKEYGNVTEDKWVDWFLPMAEEYYRTLSTTGSFVLNLGETYKKGSPTQSIYIEKLVVALVEKIGFHLCGRFYWENPCKPPMTSWVTKDRSRVKKVIEPLFWFSKTENPKADNRNVLNPYSHSFLKGVMRADFERTKRPAGFDMAHAFKPDNGGAIPGNVITIPVTPSTDRKYLEECRNHGVSPHPARMPIELPEWFISLLTKKNNIVCDLMAGSCVTAQAAEEMGRRWIVGEKSLKYLLTGSWRFPQSLTSLRWN